MLPGRKHAGTLASGIFQFDPNDLKT
jgi:hypothetical protein